MATKELSIQLASEAAKGFASGLVVKPTKRDEVLRIALSQVGYTEGPNNDNKFGIWFGYNHVAWCACFVSWVYDQAHATLPDIDNKGHKGGAYVPTMHKYFKAHAELTTDPKPGDIVLFEFTGDKLDDHIGIFVKWVDETKKEFYAVEGNTSFDEKGSQSHGGAVAYKKRKISLVSAFASPIELK